NIDIFGYALLDENRSLRQQERQELIGLRVVVNAESRPDYRVLCNTIGKSHAGPEILVIRLPRPGNVDVVGDIVHTGLPPFIVGRLVELIAEAQIQSQLGMDLPGVLEIAGHVGLAKSGVGNSYSAYGHAGKSEQEVRQSRPQLQCAAGRM